MSLTTLLDLIRIPTGVFFFGFGLLSLTLQVAGRPGFGRLDSILAATVSVATGLLILPRQRQMLAGPLVFLVGLAGILSLIRSWPVPFETSALAFLLINVAYVGLAWKTVRVEPRYHADVNVLQNASAGRTLFGTPTPSKLVIQADHVHIQRGTGRPDGEFFRNRPDVEIRFRDVERVRWRWKYLTIFVRRRSGAVDRVSIDVLPRYRWSWVDARALYLGMRERLSSYRRTHPAE